MSVKELIERLHKLQKEHGDEIEIKCWPYDGQMNPGSVGDIGVITKEIIRWLPEKSDWERRDCKPYIIISD